MGKYYFNGINSRDSQVIFKPMFEIILKYHVTTYSLELPTDMYRLCGICFNVA